MIVDVPEGSDPIIHVWGEMVPGIGPAAARFAQAVYDHSTLGLREFEAARLRIAPRSTDACSARTGAPSATASRSRTPSPTPSPSGGRPRTSASRPGWPRSTPSATPWTTTASTTTSGPG